MSLSREDIHRWPKADLHCHLDGSVRLDTLYDLARAQGKVGLLPADSRQGLQEVLLTVDHSETLETYLSWFRYTVPVLQTREALYQAGFELVEDNALENVRYLEVRYSPILHTEEGLTLEEVNRSVLKGMSDASLKYNIRTGLIICGLRDRMESASLRLAELAVSQRELGVVAFDLAGDEAGNPPKHHLHAFYFARNNLLNLTVHAGESWGPDSIHQAVFRCGAHRIGHGTTLYRDPVLMHYFIDHQIPLEVCPTSNVQTHIVDQLEDHPLKQYIEADVPVTINTDNRLFSRTTVTDELWRVHTHCRITPAQLREVVLNGFRHSFTDWRTKQDLMKSIEEELPRLPSDETPVD